jgi:hypothetical protein
VPFETGENAQADIANRANREGNASLCHPACESLIFKDAHSVVDSADPEEVNGLADVIWRAFLAGMGHHFQAGIAHPLKGAQEQAWGPALLAGIESDCGQTIAEWQHIIHQPKGSVLIEVSEDAWDELASDAVVCECLPAPLFYAFQHLLEGEALFLVGLGVEENFGVPDSLACDLGKICTGKGGEVVGGTQDGHACVINFQKSVEGTELVGGSNLSTRAIGNCDLVFFGKRQKHIGLESALKMYMELGLGKCHEVHGRSIRKVWLFG